MGVWVNSRRLQPAPAQSGKTWTPQEVSRGGGGGPAQLGRVAKKFSGMRKVRPFFLEQSQKSNILFSS